MGKEWKTSNFLINNWGFQNKPFSGTEGHGQPPCTLSFTAYILKLRTGAQCYEFKRDKSVYPFKIDKSVYPFKIDKSVYPFKKDKRVYPFKTDKSVPPLR